jgi:hypothetical protein
MALIPISFLSTHILRFARNGTLACLLVSTAYAHFTGGLETHFAHMAGAPPYILFWHAQQLRHFANLILSLVELEFGDTPLLLFVRVYSYPLRDG